MLTPSANPATGRSSRARKAIRAITRAIRNSSTDEFRQA
jgi:hypothetical protein